MRHNLVLWLLFFLISMGLGYPTLNRYDPRNTPGLYDTRAYVAMVADQPLQQDQADLAHRILVPYLARPIYKLTQNHAGTWNPALFALLAVNAFFTASTALLILWAGRRISLGSIATLIGAFLFLGNFAVANLNLSGYVDSAVNCMLMAIVWSMLTKRWQLLPLWGILGGLAKETFVPMCACMALAWWLFERRESGRGESRLLWILTMVIAASVSMVLVMAAVSPTETPFAFAASRRAESGAGYIRGMVGCLTAREFLYTFIWLLPLGVWRLKRLPRQWVAGAIAAGASALVMGAYDDALGNATRAMFSAMGPILCVSAALLLAEVAAMRED